MKKISFCVLLPLLLSGCAHGPIQLTLSKLRIGYFDDQEVWDMSASSYYIQESTYGLVLQWASDDWLKQK